jgi:hypothetical protein
MGEGSVVATAALAALRFVVGVPVSTFWIGASAGLAVIGFTSGRHFARKVEEMRPKVEFYERLKGQEVSAANTLSRGAAEIIAEPLGEGTTFDDLVAEAGRVFDSVMEQSQNLGDGEGAGLSASLTDQLNRPAPSVISPRLLF